MSASAALGCHKNGRAKKTYVSETIKHRTRIVYTMLLRKSKFFSRQILQEL